MKLTEDVSLEVVSDFKYLGAYIANCHVEFKRRKGLAWSQFWKLAKVWKSVDISLPVKLNQSSYPYYSTMLKHGQHQK